MSRYVFKYFSLVCNFEWLGPWFHIILQYCSIILLNSRYIVIHIVLLTLFRSIIFLKSSPIIEKGTLDGHPREKTFVVQSSNPPICIYLKWRKPKFSPGCGFNLDLYIEFQSPMGVKNCLDYKRLVIIHGMGAPLL